MNTRLFPMTFGLIASATLLCTGCERTEDPQVPADNTRATTPDADNTARNERDRNTDTQTPLDQGQNAKDVNITAEIRRAIMDDDAMSIKAQNIKIITENGVVTLRGPVDTQAEKDAIEAMAKAVAGVNRVDNQIEVKAG